MMGEAVVVGGGIGGLTAAAALGRAGWQVVVHERDQGLPRTGTALGIWPSALKALDAIDAGNDVRAVGQQQQTGEFLRTDGSRIVSIDTETLHRRTGDFTYLISRPALLNILDRAARNAGAVVQYGDPVEHLELVKADLHVAADGVFSQIRQRLFGPLYGPRYSGNTAWRGVVDNMPVSSFTEMWGRGRKFGVTPQEGGRANWFATAPAPEGQPSSGDEVTALRRMFGGWARPVSQILDALEETSVLHHDIYVTPPLPTYVRDSVVLVGDCAHAMTPDLGRGACEAIIDAVTLAHSVSVAPIVAAGLLTYDRQRRPPTQRLARVAGMATRLTRMKHALIVRDSLLRLSMLAGPPA